MQKVLVILTVCLIVATVAIAQTNFTATIDGTQVNPPTGSPATGSGTMTLDASNMLSYNITFSGLTAPETVAHFHGPAAPGSNAGVQVGLPSGSPKIGIAGPLTATQVADLMAGLWYINIHSQAFPGGEIRGQVLMQSVPTESKSWGAVKALFEEE